MSGVDSRRPVAYRRLADELRRLIADGEHPVDKPLPTELELTDRYRVSRQTVRRAFVDLVAEGLVYRVAGRGTFIRPADTHYRQTFDGVEDLLRLKLRTEMEICEPIRLAGAPGGVPGGWPGADSYTLRFTRLHREVVFCRTDVWLPAAVGETLRDHPDLSTSGRRAAHTIIGLIEANGYSISHAVQTTTACAATEDDAAVLAYPVGAPLLSIDRTYFDAGGAPIEHSSNVYHPERYTHTVSLSRWGTGAAHDVDERIRREHS